jgi:glyoxylase-like metal-dependent hydrolase (beta-lactamase superfamily II)
VERGITMDVPPGDRDHDRARVAHPDEMVLRQVAPGLFTMDVASMDTRVMVAEFTDHVVVVEGVYNARNGDRVAAAVRERLKKPVRFFGFSHLHGQYAGSTRSFVAEGATVLAPPSTVPLLQALVSGDHTLRPDALARAPQPLRVEVVKDRWHHEDEANALDVYNVVSEHTDEYLVYHWPRQGVLMTGDLLFLVPGKPLRGRSLRLCRTLDELGLKVEHV